jgi:hypothetical protein
MRAYICDTARITSTVLSASTLIPDLAKIAVGYTGARHTETMRFFPDNYWDIIREAAADHGVSYVELAMIIAQFVDQPLMITRGVHSLRAGMSETLDIIRETIAGTCIDTVHHRQCAMNLLWEMIILLWPSEPDGVRTNHSKWMPMRFTGFDDKFHQKRMRLVGANEPRMLYARSSVLRYVP